MFLRFYWKHLVQPYAAALFSRSFRTLSWFNSSESWSHLVTTKAAVASLHYFPERLQVVQISEFRNVQNHHRYPFFWWRTASICSFTPNNYYYVAQSKENYAKARHQFFSFHFCVYLLIGICNCKFLSHKSFLALFRSLWYMFHFPVCWRRSLFSASNRYVRECWWDVELCLWTSFSATAIVQLHLDWCV